MNLYVPSGGALRLAAVTLTTAAAVLFALTRETAIVPAILGMVTGLGTIWLLNARGWTKPKGKLRLLADGELPFDLSATDTTGRIVPRPSLLWQVLCGAILAPLVVPVVWSIDQFARPLVGATAISAQLNLRPLDMYPILLFLGAAVGLVAGLMLDNDNLAPNQRPWGYVLIVAGLGLPPLLLLYGMLLNTSLLSGIVLESRAHVLSRYYLPFLAFLPFIALLTLAVRQLAVPEVRSVVGKTIWQRGMALVGLFVGVTFIWIAPWQRLLHLLPGTSNAFEPRNLTFVEWLPHAQDTIPARQESLRFRNTVFIENGKLECLDEALALTNGASVYLCWPRQHRESLSFPAFHRSWIILERADGRYLYLAEFALTWSRLAPSPDEQWIAFTGVGVRFQHGRFQREEPERISGVYATEIATGRIVQLTDAPLIDPQWESMTRLTGIFVSRYDPKATGRYAFNVSLMPVSSPFMLTPPAFMPTPELTPFMPTPGLTPFMSTPTPALTPNRTGRD